MDEPGGRAAGGVRPVPVQPQPSAGRALDPVIVPGLAGGAPVRRVGIPAGGGRAGRVPPLGRDPLRPSAWTIAWIRARQRKRRGGPSGTVDSTSRAASPRGNSTRGRGGRWSGQGVGSAVHGRVWPARSGRWLARAPRRRSGRPSLCARASARTPIPSPWGDAPRSVWRAVIGPVTVTVSATVSKPKPASRAAPRRSRRRETRVATRSGQRSGRDRPRSRARVTPSTRCRTRRRAQAPTPSRSSRGAISAISSRAVTTMSDCRPIGSRKPRAARYAASSVSGARGSGRRPIAWSRRSSRASPKRRASGPRARASISPTRRRPSRLRPETVPGSRRRASTGSPPRARAASPGGTTTRSAAPKRATAKAPPGVSASAIRAGIFDRARRPARSSTRGPSPPRRWLAPATST